jgi:hypothetical protein
VAAILERWRLRDIGSIVCLVVVLLHLSGVTKRKLVCGRLRQDLLRLRGFGPQQSQSEQNPNAKAQNPTTVPSTRPRLQGPPHSSFELKVILNYWNFGSPRILNGIQV